MRIRTADAAALVFIVIIIFATYMFLILPGQSKNAPVSTDTPQCPAQNKVTEQKQNETSEPEKSQNRVYLYAEYDETTIAEGEKSTIENMTNDLKAIDVLQKFYEFSGCSDRYQDAMNLLTDDFIMQMTVLEELGIEKLGKADITEEFFEAYAKIIGASKIENIIEDKTEDETAYVSYIQLTDPGEGNIYRLGFKASLKRVNENWQIFLIRQDNSLTENA